VWIKATGKLGDNLALHQCVLAYASDFTLLDTALIAHGRFVFDPRLMLASLDHAIWFHRVFRADDWLLYAQDSPTSGGGRAFCRGALFTREGELVASTAQEGLVRERAAR
jgi:acyl-CoA thioesterase-2